MRALQESARTVSSMLAKMGSDEHTQLLLLAVAIGVAAGGAVLVFYKAIDVIQELVLRSALRTELPALFIIPTFVALGLVACRALVRWGAKDSPGENIPDVMYRVTVKGGVIRAPASGSRPCTASCNRPPGSSTSRVSRVEARRFGCICRWPPSRETGEQTSDKVRRC